MEYGYNIKKIPSKSNSVCLCYPYLVYVAINEHGIYRTSAVFFIAFAGFTTWTSLVHAIKP